MIEKVLKLVGYFSDLKYLFESYRPHIILYIPYTVGTFTFYSLSLNIILTQ